MNISNLKHHNTFAIDSVSHHTLHISNKKGALITRNPATAAAWLLDEKPVVVDWPDMEILMSLTTPTALERMAHAKGRKETSPFVRITARRYIDELVHMKGIHPSISEKMREKAATIYEHGTVNHPFGILFPYDTNSHLHYRLHGHLTINGEKIPTVGSMVSGPSHSFERILSLLPDNHKILAGTSANLSGDPFALGSGHHRLAGAAIDLGSNSEICIFVPHETPREGREKRKGPSTSTIFINEDKVYHVREGSTPKEMIEMLSYKAGISEIHTLSDGFRKILPYEYNKHFRHNDKLHYLVEKILYNRSKLGDFQIPIALKQLLPKPPRHSD